tara:strand:+ start:208 stop:522 length:315 start_codon:yes stop_codon:yes gene_type:complete
VWAFWVEANRFKLTINQSNIMENTKEYQYLPNGSVHCGLSYRNYDECPDYVVESTKLDGTVQRKAFIFKCDAEAYHTELMRGDREYEYLRIETLAVFEVSKLPE